MMEIEEEAVQEHQGDMQGASRAYPSLLRNAAYRWWFTSDTAAAVGLAAKGLVVPLAGYALSGSLAAAGTLGTMSLVLQQVCAIFGGTVIDRHRRGMLVALNGVIGMIGYGAIAVLLGLRA
ncbi:hypothetical protein [Bifidobacterium cuniculi]|uniref:hypothetical protein n=1 Tax=Bifidobacterium cuniculi TaxID=1688 RepID=UPI00068EBAE2|nr:hypothetical protein [Bifidobacterium cuniculi]